MTRKLARPVTLRGRHYLPGDELSDDLAAMVTNPRAWGERADAGDGGEAPLPEAPAPSPPEPRRPKGNAGHDAWAAYRVAQGVVTADEAEDLTRDELRDMEDG